MKTGRVRQKPQPSAEEQAPPPSAGPPPASPPPAGVTSQAVGIPVKRPLSAGMIAAVLLGLLACVVLVVILLSTRGGEVEWVEVTQSRGEWTSTVTVFGPQVAMEERWQTDCANDPNGAVRAGSCILRATDIYSDRVVDEYEEHAYNIYYEETYDRVYEASGTEFATTQLGADDWWKENLHYVSQEKLDEGSCQYTGYTLWVDDPQDTSQEVEVYLSECEVRDHVTVYERVYQQAPWCQCDVTRLVQIGQQSDMGTGIDVRWPKPNLPEGGRTEQAFQGRVTFVGDDYTYTTTTDELGQYQAYLKGQYYMGLKDGQPVTISNSPPQK